jgi:hypothetical protein
MEGGTMSTRIRLTLALTISFIVAALFLGTAAPERSNASVKSPYVSSLSNYSVGTAVAAKARCTHTECFFGTCRQPLEGHSNTSCAIVNGSCTTTLCGGH